MTHRITLVIATLLSLFAAPVMASGEYLLFDHNYTEDGQHVKRLSRMSLQTGSVTLTECEKYKKIKEEIVASTIAEQRNKIEMNRQGISDIIAEQYPSPDKKGSAIYKTAKRIARQRIETYDRLIESSNYIIHRWINKSFTCERK